MTISLPSPMKRLSKTELIIITEATPTLFCSDCDIGYFMLSPGRLAAYLAVVGWLFLQMLNSNRYWSVWFTNKVIQRKFLIDVLTDHRLKGKTPRRPRLYTTQRLYLMNVALTVLILIIAPIVHVRVTSMHRWGSTRVLPNEPVVSKVHRISFGYWRKLPQDLSK